MHVMNTCDHLRLASVSEWSGCSDCVAQRLGNIHLEALKLLRMLSMTFTPSNPSMHYTLFLEEPCDFHVASASTERKAKGSREFPESSSRETTMKSP